jgi:murein DD-endopeptidase MepM/ murein hydrolase activator NlpD
LPGRFAIDWVRKDEQGRSARGDADVVRNSLGYGADVLAVAHARVAAVRDGIAESDRLSTAPRHALDDKAGNYVALDLGDGRFAVYEHLAPGSIRVKQGERVRRGQVIAALGFTGDSTEPHLHFHVADSASPLAGEGLPFEIEWQGKRERPAPNALVSFD